MDFSAVARQKGGETGEGERGAPEGGGGEQCGPRLSPLGLPSPSSTIICCFSKS